MLGNSNWAPMWSDPNSTCCPWGIFSWSAILLPFIEQDNLYKAINFTVPAYSQNAPEDPAISPWAPASGDSGPGQPTWKGAPNPNILAANSCPKIYNCPSAPRGKFAPTNLQKDYSLSYGGDVVGLHDDDCCPERSTIGVHGPYNGMGWVNSKVKIADVTDGTSNTFLVMEKMNFSNQSWCSQGQGCNEFFWVHHQSQGLVFTGQPPNYTTADNRASQGPHTGGVMTSYCDGHVNFVSNNISLITYMALRTRNGGEVLGSDAP
jgi:prepilin-type processing-associated H-X9-DG protein